MIVHAILIHMNITDIRKQQKNKRQLLSTPQQFDCARKMTLQICTQRFFTQSLHIAFYLPIAGEMDTQTLIHLARESGKHCYLPVLSPSDEKHLVFLPYDTDTQLVNNRFNIPEPRFDESNIFPVEALDLVLTPLVAFDKHCHRIGMGEGYYDRTFAFLKSAQRPARPLLCGLAYDFQQVDTLHPQAWDIPMDYVVTESQIYVAPN